MSRRRILLLIFLFAGIVLVGLRIVDGARHDGWLVYTMIALSFAGLITNETGPHRKRPN